MLSAPLLELNRKVSAYGHELSQLRHKEMMYTWRSLSFIENTCLGNMGRERRVLAGSSVAKEQSTRISLSTYTKETMKMNRNKVEKALYAEQACTIRKYACKRRSSRSIINTHPCHGRQKAMSKASTRCKTRRHRASDSNVPSDRWKTLRGRSGVVLRGPCPAHFRHGRATNLAACATQVRLGLMHLLHLRQ